MQNITSFLVRSVSTPALGEDSWDVGRTVSVGSASQACLGAGDLFAASVQAFLEGAHV